MIEAIKRAAREYAGTNERPLRGYVTTLSTYASIVTGLALIARATGRRPPDRITAFDVTLLGIATHKVSRVLAKDTVTSPLRAPFTKYERPTGLSEVKEEVRGDGVRHAIGELISCPFCLGVWVATGLSAGLVFAPRLTRLVAATFTAVCASDFLQIAYDRAKPK
jgi:hypothetical protein